jgi:hypothetical protein
LDHQGVHVDHRCLDDVQAEGGHFLFVAAVGGDVAGFAVVDLGVGPRSRIRRRSGPR